MLPPIRNQQIIRNSEKVATVVAIDVQFRRIPVIARNRTEAKVRIMFFTMLLPEFTVPLPSMRETAADAAARVS